jgi:uncharacterized protein YaaW (UPF0174 family)
MHLDMKELQHILEAAPREQRQNLAALTNSAFGDDPGTLCNHIKFLRHGAIGQVFADASWKQIVTDVADHIVIDWDKVRGGRKWKHVPSQDIEAAIVTKLFQRMMEETPIEQQQQILIELQRNTNDPQLADLLLGGGAIASGMIAARMSGFGVYLMASTLLGSATSALGITLPFAAYIGMSQAIALFISPIGWAALAGGVAVVTIDRLNQPNWERLKLAVVYVSIMRHSPAPIGEK